MKDKLSGNSRKRVSYNLAKNYIQQDIHSEPQINYEHYSFSIAELVLNILIGLILAYAIGELFYDSWIVSLLLLLFLPFFLRYRTVIYGEKRRDELRTQFGDAISSVCANQKAGYSVENSFREALSDMTRLYGKSSIICKELDYIKRGLDNNLVLEQMLVNLGERSGVEDIRQFGEVFMIAKRSGGNLTEMIEMTSSVIEQRVEVEREIDLMISSKKMESNIMSLVPFFMILYMRTTSVGFLDDLYHNLTGIVIMTVCLVIYLAAYLVSKKLVDIRV